MNKQRRKDLDALYGRLQVLQTAVENIPDADDIKAGLDDAKDAEEEYRDNMPEAFQNGEKGEAASECVDQLTTACDKVEEIAEAITKMKDDLTEALEAIDNAKGPA